jgi:hypothetical protein
MQLNQQTFPTIIVTKSDKNESSTPQVVNLETTPLTQAHNQLNPTNLRPPLRKNSFIYIKKDNKSDNDYIIDSLVEEKQDIHGKVCLVPKENLTNKKVRHHGT